eukprot:849879-Rhodomonas_salina.2
MALVAPYAVSVPYTAHRMLCHYQASHSVRYVSTEHPKRARRQIHPDIEHKKPQSWYELY